MSPAFLPVTGLYVDTRRYDQLFAKLFTVTDSGLRSRFPMRDQAATRLGFPDLSRATLVQHVEGKSTEVALACVVLARSEFGAENNIKRVLEKAQEIAQEILDERRKLITKAIEQEVEVEDMPDLFGLASLGNGPAPDAPSQDAAGSPARKEGPP